jgi:hypothetical protein
MTSAPLSRRSIYNILRRAARRYFLRRFTASHALRDNQLSRFHANLGQIAGEKRCAYNCNNPSNRERPLRPDVIR